MTNSICKKVCEYEQTRQVCKGCGRTAEEITEWFYATRERKVEIAKAAKQRTKTRKEADRQRTMISLDLI
jgi:predicted Fe-S protein YdhL (DUF1289 family)